MDEDQRWIGPFGVDDRGQERQLLSAPDELSHVVILGDVRE